MQNNIETATEASSLALTSSEVIIRNVFSFCADPIAFSQVCKAFCNAITKHDAQLWITSISEIYIEECEEVLNEGKTDATSRYIWKHAPVGNLKNWARDPLYSFLLTNAVMGVSDEMLRKSAGACIALTARHNDTKYLDICEESMDQAFEAWSAAEDYELANIFVSLLSSGERRDVFYTIADIFHDRKDNYENEPLCPVVCEKIEEAGIMTEDIISLYNRIVDMYTEEGMSHNSIQFMKEVIFTLYGLHACLLLGSYEPEELYDVGFPILEKMFDEGYFPEFENNEDMTTAI